MDNLEKYCDAKDIDKIKQELKYLFNLIMKCMVKACQKGDMDIFRVLAEYNIDHDWDMLLVTAIKNDMPCMVIPIVDKGIIYNVIWSQSSYHLAFKGCLDILQHIDEKSLVCRHIIMGAVDGKQIEIIKHYMRSMLEAELLIAIKYSIRKDRSNLVLLLIKNIKTKKIIQYIVEYSIKWERYILMTNILYTYSAKLDMDSLLQIICKKGKIALASLVITWGARSCGNCNGKFHPELRKSN